MTLHCISLGWRGFNYLHHCSRVLQVPTPERSSKSSLCLAVFSDLSDFESPFEEILILTPVPPPSCSGPFTIAVNFKSTLRVYRNLANHLFGNDLIKHWLITQTFQRRRGGLNGQSTEKRRALKERKNNSKATEIFFPCFLPLSLLVGSTAESSALVNH